MNIKHTLWRIVALSLAMLALQRQLVFWALTAMVLGLLTSVLYFSLT